VAEETVAFVTARPCSSNDRVGARSRMTVWTSDLDRDGKTASVTTPERTR